MTDYSKYVRKKKTKKNSVINNLVDSLLSCEKIADSLWLLIAAGSSSKFTLVKRFNLNNN